MILIKQNSLQSFLVKSLILLMIMVFAKNSCAQAIREKSLVSETMLHPADAFTAYVYKKGEWGYNQAFTPYPSWAWWGITNRITAELDFEAWLGGVPSFNFRVGIIEQKHFLPAIAFETMYQYIKTEFDQFHNLDYLEVNRKGINWYNHLNLSWQLNKSLHLHLAGGFTYAESIEISNADTLNYVGKKYNNLVNPDFSISVDYRLKKWISLHTTFSNGSTFLYADNIATKQQFILATRMAPFIKNKRGFFNCFRFEIAYLYANFPDAETSLSGPIGFLYWQWQWGKDDKKKK